VISGLISGSPTLLPLYYSHIYIAATTFHALHLISESNFFF